ncbi:MAG: PHP domain-containing protein [Ignavibacteriaceae bacterium]|nr:PHP domain-containing protein [Ignavibacteriaceae bacterium]
MYEYIGVIHVHSVFSDGSGRVEDIGEIASEAGLDYLLLTDHNTLRALNEGYEKWYGKCLLLVGCEINDKENKNHLLAFGINETFSTRLSAKEYVRKVKDFGGIGFLAHPHEKRNHMKEHPPYPWTEWDIEDFTGIEIWNHMSEWMENLTEETKYQAFIHPLRTISTPPYETIEIWDKLNLKRKVVGIGGVDAHAHKYNILGFLEVEIFPYKVLFKSIRTHVLLKEKLIISEDSDALNKSKWQIYNALKHGSCFVANDYHADSKGFRFFAEADGILYEQGDSINSGNKIKLFVKLPARNAEIRFIRNGDTISVFNDIECSLEIIDPGVYRVEIYLEKKAWIFSNHIRIKV